MAAPVRIFGLAGSLRQGSFNRAALRAAGTLLPPDARLDEFDINGLPPYSQDLDKTPPAQVTDMKQRIRAADAVLFVTPEYNYSVPGVLKNAIDWASRPYGDSAWQGKPCAIMGATVGALGTARAQYHLRQILVFLDMHPLNRPEVMIGNADKRFDAQGNLTDEDTRKHVKAQMEALVKWTRLLRDGTK